MDEERIRVIIRENNLSGSTKEEQRSKMRIAERKG